MLRAVTSGFTSVLKAPLSRVRRHEDNRSIDQLRQDLREAAVLQYSLDHHSAATDPALRTALRSEIIRRRRGAHHLAFRRGDWALTRALAASLGTAMLEPSERLKIAVARLPPAIANTLHLMAFRGRPGPHATANPRRLDLSGRVISAGS